MPLKDKFALKEEGEKKQRDHITLGMGLGILVGGEGMAILAMFGKIGWMVCAYVWECLGECL